jgi:hypothetical protein
MSIFGSIVSKVCGAGPSKAGAIETGTMSPVLSGGAEEPPDPAPAPTGGTPVDVEVFLANVAARSNAPANWQTSIVDLVRLLDLDSLLANPKQLAEEVHYTGDTNDSAAMNVWLHKQVMQKATARSRRRCNTRSTRRSDTLTSILGKEC